MMLVELNPRFLRREMHPCHVGADDCRVTSPHDHHEMHVHVDAVNVADGIIFLCPKCFAERPDGVGVHSVICWRPRVPDGVLPGPGRWEFEGTGLSDLSLRAGSSSVLLTGGCAAHFFVEHGSIRMC